MEAETQKRETVMERERTRDEVKDIYHEQFEGLEKDRELLKMVKYNF